MSGIQDSVVIMTTNTVQLASVRVITDDLPQLVRFYEVLTGATPHRLVVAGVVGSDWQFNGAMLGAGFMSSFFGPNAVAGQHTHARFQSAKHQQPARNARVFGDDRRERNPNLLVVGKLKARRHDADDHAGDGVDGHRPADNPGVGLIPAPPELVAQQHRPAS